MGFDCNFIRADDLADLRSFQPSTREGYLEHTQRIYNYKLHTDFPLVLHIEPTNKCNQECRMCCHPTQKRKQQHSETEMVFKALSEAAVFKPWSTHFFFFGEPFLNKNIFSYIEKAKDLGLRNISTTTNLTAITRSKVTEIVRSGLDSIHISFEGLNREHYKKVRGKDTFDKARKNLLGLLEDRTRLRSNLWVSITFVRTTETDEEIEIFKETWAHLVNDIHISPQFEYRNGSLEGERRQSIAMIQTDRNDGSIMETSRNKRVACRQLWTRLVVTSNGELVPCSQNIDAELSLGNIADTSIHEAWTGSLMQELRMEHISGDFRSCRGRVCSGCTDWDWSGRTDNRPLLEKVKSAS